MVYTIVMLIYGMDKESSKRYFVNFYIEMIFYSKIFLYEFLLFEKSFTAYKLKEILRFYFDLHARVLDYQILL